MPEQLDRDGRNSDTVATPDRRRPGRVAYTNPHLIELLRKPSAPSAPAADDKARYLSPREADSLAAARGIGLATVLGALCWAVLAFGLWLLLHR